jgi:hypothetical protein
VIQLRVENSAEHGRAADRVEGVHSFGRVNRGGGRHRALDGAHMPWKLELNQTGVQAATSSSG